MSEVEAPVHVGVGESYHKFLLGGAVGVELRLGLEDLVRLPALLRRGFHGGQTVPPGEGLGLICMAWRSEFWGGGGWQ